MIYRVEFKPAARREIKKLPRRAQETVVAKAESLAGNPLPSGVKKLQDSTLGSNLLRVSAGDYRIIYQIQENALIVLIVRIGNRRDVYK